LGASGVSSADHFDINRRSGRRDAFRTLDRVCSLRWGAGSNVMSENPNEVPLPRPRPENCPSCFSRGFHQLGFHQLGFHQWGFSGFQKVKEVKALQRHTDLRFCTVTSLTGEALL
jgi:hypothetical protein